MLQQSSPTPGAHHDALLQPCEAFSPHSTGNTMQWLPYAALVQCSPMQLIEHF
jgi:hypothetical protein